MEELYENTKSDDAVVVKEAKNDLHELSQHRMELATSLLSFGGDKHGIFCAQPVDLMHNLALHPEGFMRGHTNFPSLDHVLNSFKKNPRGPGGSGSNRPSASSSSGVSRSMAISTATNLSPAKPSRWGA
eukprot:scaffold191888_cov67-Attheya_sp.AAC.2